MGRAIGMVELSSIARGIETSDSMLKAAQVELLRSVTVCPGKYMVIISGDLSSVRASVDAAKTRYPDQLIDSFVLGNPDESIYPAIYGAAEVEDAKALGVIETFSSAAAVVAADTAAKTSNVQLVELRLARGMCGKSYLLITGDVAAVTAAIERARDAVGEDGMLLDSSVIPSPDKKLWQSIL